MRLLLAAALVASFAPSFVTAQQPGEAAKRAEANQPPEYRKMMKRSKKYAPKSYKAPNHKKPPKQPKQKPTRWGAPK